jgi:hypothetical protein
MARAHSQRQYPDASGRGSRDLASEKLRISIREALRKFSVMAGIVFERKMMR